MLMAQANNAPALGKADAEGLTLEMKYGHVYLIDPDDPDPEVQAFIAFVREPNPKAAPLRAFYEKVRVFAVRIVSFSNLAISYGEAQPFEGEDEAHRRPRLRLGEDERTLPRLMH